MPKSSLDDFLDKTENGRNKNNIASDWKKAGKIQFFLVKGADFGERVMHNYPRVKFSDEGGDGKRELGQTMIVCDDGSCDICRLVAICKELPDDEKVLKIEIGSKTNPKIIYYTASDITGQGENQNWKRRLGARHEWVLPIVRIPNKKDDNQEIRKENLIVPKSAGNKVREFIKRKMDKLEEAGEDRINGHPSKRPYPFLIVYNEKATPNDKYAVDEGLAKRNDEINALIRSEPLDMDELLKITPASDIRRLIKKFCCNDYVLKELGYTDIAKESKIVKKREDEDEVEVDVDEDEEKPKLKFKTQRKFKIQKKTISCPDCNEKIPADSSRCPECGSKVEIPFGDDD